MFYRKNTVLQHYVNPWQVWNTSNILQGGNLYSILNSNIYLTNITHHSTDKSTCSSPIQLLLWSRILKETKVSATHINHPSTRSSQTSASILFLWIAKQKLRITPFSLDTTWKTLNEFQNRQVPLLLWRYLSFQGLVVPSYPRTSFPMPVNNQAARSQLFGFLLLCVEEILLSNLIHSPRPLSREYQ